MEFKSRIVNLGRSLDSPPAEPPAALPGYVPRDHDLSVSRGMPGVPRYTPAFPAWLSRYCRGLMPSYLRKTVEK
jgi:hypothetical protein